jgi:beta-xylosidase
VPYGRIVHLQPTVWTNGFPVIGDDKDGDGTGQPVMKFRKPNVGKEYAVSTPQDSDEFIEPILAPQWQWHANFDSTWAFPFPERSVLRMNSVQTPEGAKNLWDVPNLLLQKFPPRNLRLPQM